MLRVRGIERVRLHADLTILGRLALELAKTDSDSRFAPVVAIVSGGLVLDHVTVRVPDLAVSAAFYTLVLRTLGIEISVRGNNYVEWDDFALASANVETRMMTAAPPTQDMHVAFIAPSRERVDEFWRVGTEAGYRDNGAPGERVIYPGGYYAAFLLDPDGNNVEAVHHRSARAET
jgi:catechol 2,3-dioxygenase-like lactoylglutathione lyase family enzyme